MCISHISAASYLSGRDLNQEIRRQLEEELRMRTNKQQAGLFFKNVAVIIGLGSILATSFLLLTSIMNRNESAREMCGKIVVSFFAFMTMTFAWSDVDNLIFYLMPQFFLASAMTLPSFPVREAATLAWTAFFVVTVILTCKKILVQHRKGMRILALECSDYM